MQVPDEILVERVVGRRLDPETGEIYHIKYKPPPKEIEGRLTVRSDDTEEKVRSSWTRLLQQSAFMAARQQAKTLQHTGRTCTHCAFNVAAQMASRPHAWKRHAVISTYTLAPHRA